MANISSSRVGIRPPPPPQPAAVDDDVDDDDEEVATPNSSWNSPLFRPTLLPSGPDGELWTNVRSSSSNNDRAESWMASASPFASPSSEEEESNRKHSANRRRRASFWAKWYDRTDVRRDRVPSSVRRVGRPLSRDDDEAAAPPLSSPSSSFFSSPPDSSPLPAPVLLLSALVVASLSSCRSASIRSVASVRPTARASSTSNNPQTAAR